MSFELLLIRGRMLHKNDKILKIHKGEHFKVRVEKEMDPKGRYFFK